MCCFPDSRNARFTERQFHSLVELRFHSSKFMIYHFIGRTDILLLLDAGTGFWIDRRFVRDRILSFVDSSSTNLIADFYCIGEWKPWMCPVSKQCRILDVCSELASDLNRNVWAILWQKNIRTTLVGHFRSYCKASSTCHLCPRSQIIRKRPYDLYDRCCNLWLCWSTSTPKFHFIYLTILIIMILGMSPNSATYVAKNLLVGDAIHGLSI